jgi:molybdate transport system substrate-binding protein
MKALLSKIRHLAASLLLFSTVSPFVFGGQVSIAVTSNFDFTSESLKKEFESRSGHEIKLTHGSSSQLFDRIMGGEQFDLFLSDDIQRPSTLESSGRSIPGSRFTYALGKLVLWSVNSKQLNENTLLNRDFELLAVTNPRLSPYGRASEEFLSHLELWDSLQGQIVMGPNIGQTYHFAISGDVDMALIPFSQIVYGRYLQAGTFWTVPESYYSPIEQQAVLLTDNNAAEEFLDFLKGNTGRQIISANGFNLPK